MLHSIDLGNRGVLMKLLFYCGMYELMDGPPIERLLLVEPSERLHVGQALQHPYFAVTSSATVNRQTSSPSMGAIGGAAGGSTTPPSRPDIKTELLCGMYEASSASVPTGR
ncbi:hypothetical protein H257_16767 [Aphanomyces astaci]|uniref:Protein kinase domain-containing protein n=1 Tax=Aphanomyces astaci TaxID=112090 RepID=W4FJQ1_APHAT|nr:hypothetical protein H257_16767 [Aphanomyces astaci]ETV66973.1 hypothetical protein H257_16767 [Aphanomyces astaci]|eukprot:XP_009843614.1 hypothetical protein H257_16767 [Aphanomyces astaci]